MPADYKVHLTRHALDDIEEIREFIERDSNQNAARMVERSFDDFDKLKSFRHRTVVEYLSTRLAHPVRKVSVKRYVIYFRIDEVQKVVVIRHVRHGARHLLSESDPAD